MRHARLITPQKLLLAAGFALLCAPTAALAQEEKSDPAIPISISCSTSGLTIGGISTFGPGAVEREEQRIKDELEIQRMSALDMYLKQNEAAVRMALVLGAGRELDELGALAGLGKLTAAQRVNLRANRASLLKILAIPTDHPTPRHRAARLYTALRALIPARVATITTARNTTTRHTTTTGRASK